MYLRGGGKEDEYFLDRFYFIAEYHKNNISYILCNQSKRRKKYCPSFKIWMKTLTNQQKTINDMKLIRKFCLVPGELREPEILLPYELDKLHGKFLVNVKKLMDPIMSLQLCISVGLIQVWHIRCGFRWAVEAICIWWHPKHSPATSWTRSCSCIKWVWACKWERSTVLYSRSEEWKHQQKHWMACI